MQEKRRTWRVPAGLGDEAVDDEAQQGHHAAGSVVVAAVLPHQQQHVEQPLRTPAHVIHNNNMITHGTTLLS